MTDAELLDEFVRTFAKLDHLFSDSPPAELDDGTDGSEWARPKWKPAAIQTDRTALDEVYRLLPAHFPPLFEQLLLSYRWLDDVELDNIVRLRGNSPGPSLSGFLSNITADPALVKVLFEHGLIPFGTAGADNYDPVCFDTTRRHRDGDCPVLRVEHESILCHDRLGESWQIVDSFRSLVNRVVAKAAEMPDR